MGDEFRTLLRIEGDAAGAKQACAETKGALQDLASTAAGGDSGSFSQSTEAIKENASAAEDAGAKQQAFANTMGETASGARAFTRVLGQINPELGELVAIGQHAKAALEIVFTPIGATALLAAVAINAVTQSLERATKAAQDFLEKNERIRNATLDTQTQLSKELGKAGKGSEEALNVGTGIVKQAVDAGYSPETATKVAAAVVGNDGNVNFKQEDLRLLMAGQERGMFELGGASPNEQAANLRRASALIDRNRESLEQSDIAFTRPRVRSAGTPQQILVDKYGYTPDQAAQAVKDMGEFSDKDLETRQYPRGYDTSHYLGIQTEKEDQFVRAKTARNYLEEDEQFRNAASAPPPPGPAGASQREPRPQGFQQGGGVTNFNMSQCQVYFPNSAVKPPPSRGPK